VVLNRAPTMLMHVGLLKNARLNEGANLQKL
jgi:hypothetical protein